MHRQFLRNVLNYWWPATLCSALFTLLPATAMAQEAVWSLLKHGGQIVLMRHAVTTPGPGDPPGFRLDDCSTQRNLTDRGRMDAKRVGDAFLARGIAVERVLASPWCRCIETANLAFGNAETTHALGNLFMRPENQDRQLREMRQLVESPKAGNRVLVSHGSTILALTGVSLDTAEMLIVTPQARGEFVVQGRLSVPQ